MENIDEKESGLKWILPLVVLILLVVIGFWFCSKPAAAPPVTNANTANANSNTNK
jgi:Na+/H+ antiporter NhaC